jgi:ABC-type branched-subunit amino acid transport system substrate-binding protein
MLLSSAVWAADPLVIAAIGPITGVAAPRGKDLEQAARLAIDEANSAGGIGGRKIELTVYDDGDQPAQARELAMKAASTPALGVLGQVASSAAAAAGEVYKSQGIAAITGAASEMRVTKDNDWYFRLFRDAAGQGHFMADYARDQFPSHEVLVIRELGTAGNEFATAFREEARRERLRITADLEFQPEQAQDPVAMEALAQKAAKVWRKGQVIVLGAQYGETPALLRVLREKIGPFPAMGYSSLATEALTSKFDNAARARHAAASDYTERFLVAAPQLGDVAEYAQTVFASRYKARYGVEPTPEAVRWYEAARLLLQAMALQHVTGNDRTGDRRKIRDWLASLTSLETSAQSVAGPIYFDRDHNAVRGIAVGRFYEGHLISAPVQFTPAPNPDQVPGWDRLVSSGMVTTAGGVQVVRTPVVYAGIDLNSLDNIDVRAGTFAADFFLWFRMRDDLNLDLHEVEFPTATSGAALGKEIWRRTRDGFTTVAFHVKGVFHADYEFSRFPFDRQVLQIPIQVRNSNSYTLLLAYGRYESSGARGGNDSALASKLWQQESQIFFRDVVALQSNFGESDVAAQRGVQFNRINASVTIKRDVFGFAVKNFIPLLCILVAVLVGYSIAPDVINPRVSIGVTALLTTSVLYQKLAGDLPTVTYMIGMDYVFFSFFAFCVLFLGLTVVTYETHKQKREAPTSWLTRGGVLATMMGIVVTLMFVWFRYWSKA